MRTESLRNEGVGAHHGRVTLGDTFEARPNAFNALRLVFAAAVIVRHTFLFRGDELPAPLIALTSTIPVDGFFVLSGFLIVRSWERRPQLRTFARARAARLLPGLWGCLAVTAFIIAPLMAGPVRLSDQLRYVIGNAALYVTAPGISNTPGPPVPMWDTSLWTLFWEGSCYVAVAALGLIGWLRLRTAMGVVFCTWAVLLAMWASGQSDLLAGTGGAPLPNIMLAFGLGSVMWLGRDGVPMDGRLALVATALLAGSLFTPDYQVLGALPLAYLCLWGGVECGRFRWLRWRQDLSYGVYVYGAPVQQSLILAGAAGLAWWRFALASWLLVAPIAALSWFLIERPVLEHVRGSTRRARERLTA